MHAPVPWPHPQPHCHAKQHRGLTVRDARERTLGADMPQILELNNFRLESPIWQFDAIYQFAQVMKLSNTGPSSTRISTHKNMWHNLGFAKMLSSTASKICLRHKRSLPQTSKISCHSKSTWVAWSAMRQLSSISMHFLPLTRTTKNIQKPCTGTSQKYASQRFCHCVLVVLDGRSFHQKNKKKTPE